LTPPTWTPTKPHADQLRRPQPSLALLFDRKVGAERKRTSRLLPKGWDRYKAQEFDRIETARLYALATGVTKPEHLIDAAVLLYLTPP
jgi:hypothetical protein